MSTTSIQGLVLENAQARLSHIRQTRAAQNAAWAAEERDLLASIEQHLLDTRPAYPTSEQRAAIAEVARLVRAKLPHGSEHFIGDPVLGTDTVLFSSQSQRINVLAGAPYAQNPHDTKSTRLWCFSEKDALAFRDLIVSHGLRISNSWPHDDGIAFIVTAADSAE